MKSYHEARVGGAAARRTPALAVESKIYGSAAYGDAHRVRRRPTAPPPQGRYFCFYKTIPRQMLFYRICSPGVNSRPIARGNVVDSPKGRRADINLRAKG